MDSFKKAPKKISRIGYPKQKAYVCVRSTDGTTIKVPWKQAAELVANGSAKYCSRSEYRKDHPQPKPEKKEKKSRKVKSKKPGNLKGKAKKRMRKEKSGK